MDAQRLMNELKLLDEDEGISEIPVFYQYGDTYETKTCRHIHVERDRFGKMVRIILKTIKQKQ